MDTTVNGNGNGHQLEKRYSLESRFIKSNSLPRNNSVPMIIMNNYECYDSNKSIDSVGVNSFKACASCSMSTVKCFLILTSTNVPWFNQNLSRHRTKQLLAQQEILFPKLFSSLRSAIQPLISFRYTGVESKVYSEGFPSGVKVEDDELEECPPNLANKPDGNK
ncbi:uncharacterized protein LOC113465668 [Diaphorina citri]|uniref:Uncharacterized protein LOC113465668 n=1 Tax=Diaphorina citri TaxID=121845 RepID=A0A3Q0IPB9_DIACI|nr:uncharacterized protein LOC113465668 [Diaphorina citri]